MLCSIYAPQPRLTALCCAASITWQVGIGIGDLALAYQCLRIAISINPQHAEAYNNLGVLEYRKGNDEQARAYFRWVLGEGCRHHHLLHTSNSGSALLLANHIHCCQCQTWHYVCVCACACVCKP